MGKSKISIGLPGASLLDAYTVRARVVPAIIAGAPALAFATIFISGGHFGLPIVVAGVGLIVLFSVFADFARRRGLLLQPAIFDEMGGAPSTTMQRHRDLAIDKKTKGRIHDFLSTKLGDAAPTEAEEEHDPTAADLFYERGAAWLRENTRDAKKFSILFSENVSYGFWRNLYALKWLGLALNVTILAVCVLLVWFTGPLNVGDRFHKYLLAVISVSIIHAGYLAFVVRRRNVLDSARIYARQLILACESELLRDAKPKKKK